MRLDEWQNYLEGEFLDEIVDTITPDNPPIKTGPGSWFTSRQKENVLPDADNWIPPKPAFGIPAVVFSASSTTSAPQQPKLQIAVKTETIETAPQECSQVEP